MYICVLYFKLKNIIIMDLEDIGFPKIIYKYRDWNNKKHKRILTDNEIYLASPTDFNQSQECNLPIDWEARTEKEYKGFFEMSKNYHNESESFETIMENLKNPKIRKEREELNKNIGYDNTGVFSTSKIYNGKELWDNFGDKQKGFCVGFDLNLLNEYNDQEQNLGTFSLVQYYNEANTPKVPPFSLTTEERTLKAIKELTFLPDSFEYEAEFRIVKIYPKNRNIILPNKVFKEIILGNKMSEEHKNEIIELAKGKYPNIQIFEMKKGKNEKGRKQIYPITIENDWEF